MKSFFYEKINFICLRHCVISSMYVSSTEEEFFACSDSKKHFKDVEMLYADDLVLTSETMGGLREKFWK